MYRWLKAYLKEFGSDFPFSEVADRNEYEICRLIQWCVEHHTPYSGDSEGGGSAGGDGEEEDTSAAVGTAVVGTALAG